MESEADTLKAAGNEYFRAGQFTEAIEAYSRALVARPNDAVLLGNRSACHLALKEWELAAADAQAAVESDASYVKGYYRLGTALFNLGRLEDASDAASAGLKAEPGNKTLLALQRQIRQKQPKQQAPSQLYADRIEQQQTPGQRFLAWLMDLLSRPGAAELSHELQGTFKQLLNPDVFVKLIYPGLSAKEAQQLPRSLKELLQNQFIQAELERSMEKIEAKAESVLSSVKQKGAAKGQFMDAATEAALRPQVLQEAFARELIEIVKRLNMQFQQVSLMSLQLASPSDIRSGYEQLDDNVVAAVRTAPVAVQAAYLGQEWAQVILNDLVRFEEVEGLDPLPPSTQRQLQQLSEKQRLDEGAASRVLMRWLELDDIRDEYPALGELLQNMHALRYELNAKCDSCRLAVDSPGHTLLVKHLPPPPGQDASPQWDVAKANMKMCLVYHVTQETNSPAQLLVTDSQSSATATTAAPTTTVDVSCDQLVMYDCTRTIPARTSASYTYYAVYSFAPQVAQS